MNNTMHTTELRVWRQCVYCTQQLWQKNDHFPSSHDLRCSRNTPILIRDLHTCSEVLHTVTTAFSNRTVVEGNKFQNFLRILSNFPSQAHVKTANCAAPPVHRRRRKKYSNLVLCLSVGYLCHLPAHLSFPPLCFLAMKCPSKTPFDVTTNLLSFHHTSITNSSAVQFLEYHALRNIAPPEGTTTLT